MLDSVGVGDAPDAADYGDEGSNTLGNLSHAVGGICVPTLQQLGLGNLTEILGVPPLTETAGVWGRLTQQAADTDSMVGHWEIMGQIRHEPFPTYPEGFPAEIIDQFEALTDRPVIGNRPASGTEIIEELVEEHLDSGALIVYTSGDSVFQIAAHKEVVPVDELYRCCEIAREILTEEHQVARVIARPFIGKPGSLERTSERRDYPLCPPYPTGLDLLEQAGVETVGVGKIEDIFAGRGVERSLHISDNAHGSETIIELLSETGPMLIFANLNDFDTKFGHRNDPEGYAEALEEFDDCLAEMMQTLPDDAVMMLTADHGTDPTTEGTDHTRERVPLLAVGEAVKPGVSIGTRKTFADIAATICELFEAESPPEGCSFAGQMMGEDA